MPESIDVSTAFSVSQYPVGNGTNSKSTFSPVHVPVESAPVPSTTLPPLVADNWNESASGTVMTQ